MMIKKQETVADIVDDMLTTARVCGDGAVRYDMFHYARRIEAAWKRERVEVRETASTTILKESVPVSVENAAAMREALKKIGAMEIPHNFQIERSDIVDACYELTKAIKIANAALSEPQRKLDL
jgi:hypothetical protein